MADMGAISDVTSEFKQAGPKEKTLIVIAVIGVAGVAWYLYTQRQASASQQGVLNARSGTETPQPSGYAETSAGVPTIPFGTNPLYDPAGNLIAFQTPGGGGTPGPIITPTPVPQPAPGPPAPPVSTPPPTPAPKTLTVGTWPNWNGSLWGIAQNQYGNGSLWPTIYNANKGVIGSNPNLIKPGQVLVIPTKP